MLGARADLPTRTLTRILRMPVMSAGMLRSMLCLVRLCVDSTGGDAVLGNTPLAISRLIPPARDAAAVA